MFDFSIEELKRQIDRRAAQTPLNDPYPDDFFHTPPTQASVLVPMFRHQGQWHLLFIRRTEHPDDRHSGQVAFPGGKMDDVDKNTIATALRESHEEIGLPHHRNDIVGCLNQYRTVSNFLVTPVISVIPWPLELLPDPTEVARVFSIPLGWLADPDNLSLQRRRLDRSGTRIPVYHYRHYERERLWGITARITVNLLQTLGCRDLPV